MNAQLVYMRETPERPLVTRPVPTMRTVRRFAWLPVLLTGEPWHRRRSWVHLDWYVARQALRAPDDLEPWGSLQPSWQTVEVSREATTSRH